MPSTRSLSSRTRILIVAGLAAAGVVGGVAGWAPAAQAGCYRSGVGNVCVPAFETPGVGGSAVEETRAIASRTAARAVGMLGGCDSCTPGIVVPIGPVPIGPAGDDLINTVEGANRTVAKAVAAVTGGCDSCTPGIVVPIGPVPIGPAGDDLINTVEDTADRHLPRRRF